MDKIGIMAKSRMAWFKDSQGETVAFIVIKNYQTSTLVVGLPSSF
jgi:hypothetical protein